MILSQLSRLQDSFCRFDRLASGPAWSAITARGQFRHYTLVKSGIVGPGEPMPANSKELCNRGRRFSTSCRPGGRNKWMRWRRSWTESWIRGNGCASTNSGRNRGWASGIHLAIGVADAHLCGEGDVGFGEKSGAEERLPIERSLRRWFPAEQEATLRAPFPRLRRVCQSGPRPQGRPLFPLPPPRIGRRQEKILPRKQEQCHPTGCSTSADFAAERFASRERMLRRSKRVREVLAGTSRAGVLPRGRFRQRPERQRNALRIDRISVSLKG